MPLPANGVAWPPPGMLDVLDRLEEWSAWYAGDAAGLRAVYSRAVRVDRPAQYRGGASGALARAWWGRPVGDLTKREDKLHVPIAADLCQASADLLFSEPPTLSVDDTRAQDRLDEMADDGMLTTLAEGAEVAAALGGVFMRVAWDADIRPAPFLTVVHADHAVPEFRWGHLVAVTFWWVVADDGSRVMRHLERHELEPDGTGIVLHGLYDGTRDSLGRAVPLVEHPSTAPLAELVDDRSAITTGSPGLAVTYVPNQRPQRRWRAHPVGANLGRSDLDGVEPLMDALDETYSSWMRDIRLGKARVLVARQLLETYGPGAGVGFDLEQDVFSPLNAMASRGDGGGLPVEQVQFDIRVAEHQATASELAERIRSTAGYSASTFGEASSGAAQTATEVVSRERRSYMTRDRKIRLWRPAVGHLTRKLLTVDAAVFGGAVAPDVAVLVEFGDAVQADPEALARTAQALRTARAASTETLVAMQHPDWQPDDVAAEVALILAEDALADPTATVPPAAVDAGQP